MISSGQKIFALIFILGFLVAMFFAYRSDLKKSKELFKGTWVTLAVVGVVIILFVMIRYVYKVLAE